MENSINILNNISDFIDEERKYLENREANLFANSLREIIRYRKFLRNSIQKHKSLVSKYAKAFYDFQKSIDKSPGSHTVTVEQGEIMERMNILADEVHQEIEIFYMFFKILIDKIFFFLLYYFGKSKIIKKLESHNSMLTTFENSKILKIEKYCLEKNVTLDKVLFNKMKNIRDDILSFREYQIVHNPSPKVIRGTGIDGTMSIHKLYPENERDAESKISLNLEMATDHLDNYITLVIDFIKKNKDKTALPTIKF